MNASSGSASSKATAEPSGRDRADVAELLGRAPAAPFRIALRCPHGRAAIIENDPLDVKGHPFPTRYWLACRSLSAAVSGLEARGGVEALDMDEGVAAAVALAHERHAQLHAGYRVAGAGDPRHAKCLHAHLAFGLAQGGSPVADWILERSGAEWPRRCCVEPVVE